ncbi:MAG: hypothetical protein VKJ06_03855 [Vampirovibrionales bacterium]|nr:hypothetical protein [Vampirovibrionales bacterium]
MAYMLPTTLPPAYSPALNPGRFMQPGPMYTPSRPVWPPQQTGVQATSGMPQPFAASAQGLNAFSPSSYSLRQPVPPYANTVLQNTRALLPLMPSTPGPSPIYAGAQGPYRMTLPMPERIYIPVPVPVPTAPAYAPTQQQWLPNGLNSPLTASLQQPQPDSSAASYTLGEPMQMPSSQGINPGASRANTASMPYNQEAAPMTAYQEDFDSAAETNASAARSERARRLSNAHAYEEDLAQTQARQNPGMHQAKSSQVLESIKKREQALQTELESRIEDRVDEKLNQFLKSHHLDALANDGALKPAFIDNYQTLNTENPMLIEAQPQKRKTGLLGHVMQLAGAGKRITSASIQGAAMGLGTGLAASIAMIATLKPLRNRAWLMKGVSFATTLLTTLAGAGLNGARQTFKELSGQGKA